MESYSVSGGMRVNPLIVTDEVLNCLEFNVNANNLSLDMEGDRLTISLTDGLSLTQAAEVDDALFSFAQKYALESSFLLTRLGDGEIQELFVGPSGCDLATARINCINARISMLVKERDLLIGGLDTEVVH